jgi:hypothetical protein
MTMTADIADALDSDLADTGRILYMRPRPRHQLFTVDATEGDAGAADATDMHPTPLTGGGTLSTLAESQPIWPLDCQYLHALPGETAGLDDDAGRHRRGGWRRTHPRGRWRGWSGVDLDGDGAVDLTVNPLACDVVPSRVLSWLVGKHPELAKEAADYAAQLRQRSTSGFEDDDAAAFGWLKKIAQGAGRAASGAVKAVGGAAVHLVTHDPLTRVVSGIAKGENVGSAIKAGINTAGQNLATYGPYAQAVLSLVPGVGTGVSAALGGAIALSQGKPIDQIALAAARGAVPGGPLAQKAFDVGTSVASSLAKGQRLDGAALEAARNALPGGEAAKAAFDTAVGLAQGRNIQQAAMAAAMRTFPQAAKSAEFAQRIARGENLVTAAMSVGGPAALAAIRKYVPAMPIPADKVAALAQDIARGKNVGTAALNIAKDYVTKELSGTIAKKVGPMAERALSQANIPGRLSRFAVSAPMSMLPPAVQVVAQALVKDPGMRSMQAAEIARRMNVPLTTVRSAMASIAGGLARVAGGAGPTPGLRPEPGLESKVGPETRLDQLAAQFASRASPTRYTPRPIHPHVRRVVGRFYPRMRSHPLIREASGLDATGRIYVVEAGDSPIRITVKLLGPGTDRRYVELIAANPQKRTVGSPLNPFSGTPQYNFASLLAGEKLNVPLTWSVKVPTALPPLPLPAPTPAPAPSPPIAAIPGLPPLPAPSAIPGFIPAVFTTAPTTNPPGDLFRKKMVIVGELGVWGKQTGRMTDYPSDFDFNTNVVDSRFTAAVKKYQAFAVEKGESIRTDGVFDEATDKSLENYIVKNVAGGVVPVPGAPAPSAVPGIPGIPPIPGVTPGAPPLALPPGGSPVTVTAPGLAPAKKEGGGGAAIAVGLGLLVAGFAFGWFKWGTGRKAA